MVYQWFYAESMNIRVITREPIINYLIPNLSIQRIQETDKDYLKCFLSFLKNDIRKYAFVKKYPQIWLLFEK